MPIQENALNRPRDTRRLAFALAKDEQHGLWDLQRNARPINNSISK